MLTGQYYYYLKTLDQVIFPLTADQASRLEIPSLPYIPAQAFSQIDPEDIPNEIKNLFISAYEPFLRENNLNAIANMWEWLTSPLLRQDISNSIKTSSDYQLIIKNWGNEGFNFDKLGELIRDGLLVWREDDLALLYGLKLLDTFTRYNRKIDNEDSDINSLLIAGLTDPKNESARKTFSTKPQILIITSDELAPLFTNIGCEAIPMLTNKEKIVVDIKDILKIEPSIKVILVEGEGIEDYVTYIRKNCDPNLLVSSITLPNENQAARQNQDKTFFDEIARATLGVRLE